MMNRSNKFLILLFVLLFTPLINLAVAGPSWVDLKSVNVKDNSAPGLTGQQWCDNHFGVSFSGAWECAEGTGSNCTSQVPNNTDVHCGRLAVDGTTPYTGAARIIAPFGYGRVERHLVNQSAPGRTGKWWCDNYFSNNFTGFWKCLSVSGLNSCSTIIPNNELVSCSQYASVESKNVGTLNASGRSGQWWCTNHFGNNLGGSWDCLEVSGGDCSAAAPANSTVTCGRYTVVNEAPFVPSDCFALSLDPAEVEFCKHTEYMTSREASTIYLYNDFIRAGINRSFGGALFELYGTDKRNRIKEHGGAAVQLSIWGYAEAPAGAAYFTTTICDPSPYTRRAKCQTMNRNIPCRAYAANGAQISDCVTETACGKWSAGAPWNPIQAQAINCGWNGASNDVDQVTANGGDITFVKHDPYHFTKTTAFSGMTWQVTGRVPSDRPYIKLTYQMTYNGTSDTKVHGQEIPALFTDASIAHWYYFYSGISPYADVNGVVTRLRSDFGTHLKLPSRFEPFPQPPSGVYYNATEEWMTVCDRYEDQCLTVVSFAPEVKTFRQRQHYITPLGRFELLGGDSKTWDIYLFPYRYDDVVGGKSIRQWIYDLESEPGRVEVFEQVATPPIDP